MITSISLVAEFEDSLLPELSVVLVLRVVLRFGRTIPIPPVSRYRPEGVFEGDCRRYCARTSQPR